MSFTSSASTKVYLAELLRGQGLPLPALEKKKEGMQRSHERYSVSEVKLGTYFAPSLSNRGTLEKFKTPQI